MTRASAASTAPAWAARLTTRLRPGTPARLRLTPARIAPRRQPTRLPIPRAIRSTPQSTTRASVAPTRRGSAPRVEEPPAPPPADPGTPPTDPGTDPGTPPAEPGADPT